jgi:hypothetical protein
MRGIRKAIAQYPGHKAVRVCITTIDGELLDDFIVCHYKSPDSGSFSDEENVGSHASNALLSERIERYVKAVRGGR